MVVALIIIAVVVAFIIGATIYQYVKPPGGKIVGHDSTAAENEGTIEQTARGNASSTWIGLG